MGTTGLSAGCRNTANAAAALEQLMQLAAEPCTATAHREPQRRLLAAAPLAAGSDH